MKEDYPVTDSAILVFSVVRNKDRSVTIDAGIFLWLKDEYYHKNMKIRLKKKS